MTGSLNQLSTGVEGGTVDRSVLKLLKKACSLLNIVARATGELHRELVSVDFTEHQIAGEVRSGSERMTIRVVLEHQVPKFVR